MKKYLFTVLALSFLFLSCEGKKEKEQTSVVDEQSNKKGDTASFNWEAANVYFLLTDRFNNGDLSNDTNFDRTEPTGKLRGFEGGDIKGVTQKIREGYFSDLGINAIWMTPIVEQIHGGTDEGTGYTYAYHGYWAKDWTAVDPNYGTAEDLKEMVEVAHDNGIRVLLDAVINHTGPVTDKDPVWPSDWVRTEPQCKYNSYESTISCTLVKNLPDILTDSNKEVELPPQLVEKWKAEGRYDQEVKELDDFFKSTGHPRAPRFYIMKWLADYIHDYGIDGYRVDTVKHTEEYVWQEFKDVCDAAFAKFKTDKPEKVLDDAPFYLVGEVYGYGLSGGQFYDFGDKKVNYFDDAFNSLINFDFKWLVVEGAVGDANLRSNMNWEQIADNQAILEHWNKLGQFRRDHPAVGAGIHQMITSQPYVFYRSLSHSGFDDQVVIGLDLSEGEKEIDVRTIFADGTKVRDAYSGATATVEGGKASFDTETTILLVEKQN